MDPYEQQGEPRELTEEERKKYMVGQCNYLMLMTISLAAFILSGNATWYCDFASRELGFKDGFDIDQTCADANLSSYDEEVCKTFLSKHGIGFYYWLGTVPVDQDVCLSYTMYIPGVGYVTPDFDSAFTAGLVFAIMATVFGAFGWFSVIFASCCPVSQERIKGLSCYFTFACICQCFTFLLYASDICSIGFYEQYFPDKDLSSEVESVNCGLGTGAKCSISAAVLYLVCSALAPMSMAPKPIGRNGYYGQAETNQPAEPAAAPAADDA